MMVYRDLGFIVGQREVTGLGLLLLRFGGPFCWDKKETVEQEFSYLVLVSFTYLTKKTFLLENYADSSLIYSFFFLSKLLDI